MDTLEQILKQWEKDSVVDQTEPSRELLRIPILHSKYINMLVKHKASSKKTEFDIIRLKKMKWEYYSGKSTHEDLQKNNWEPFQLKLLKTDIPMYMESDPDIIELQEKKFAHDQKVSVIEEILKQLKDRTYQLKDYISWEKFIGGN